LIVAVGASSFGLADPQPLDILLRAGCEVRRNPYGRKLTEDEAVAFLQGASGLLAGLEPLTRLVLSACPDLRAIARVGVGLDNVDQAACASKGIKVSNTPDGPTEAVAELTLAALLAIARGLVPANNALHACEWKKEIGFSLRGLKVLVVGAGRIGRRVRDTLALLGCEVKTQDPFAPADFASLAEALPWAEVVSLHASGKEQLIGTAEIAAMRDRVVILNSARGGLIDENALYDGLVSGKIGACWLDVFRTEPYSGKLAACPQALLTPHIATYTKQCRLSMEIEAAGNLLRDLGITAVTPDRRNDVRV
jgi:D-3-phosphoglycerate dehydrogenase